MVQADDEEEFRESWQSHINQLYKLGHSLPDDEVDGFIDEVEDVEEYIEKAAEQSFEE